MRRIIKVCLASYVRIVNRLIHPSLSNINSLLGFYFNKVRLNPRYRMIHDNISYSPTSGEAEDSNTLSDSVISSESLATDRPLIVSIEGNIGSGKSTLIKYFESASNVEAVHEPVDKWTNLNGHNALNLLYKDSSRWSFSFNKYASLTRVQMHETVTKKPIVMLERSLYSTRFCFVENCYQSKQLHPMEYQILCRWFDYLHTNESLPVDLFVYLRADPEKCYRRLKERNRREEASVPFALIEQLHRFHESWLIEKKFPVPAPVLILDANTDMPEMNGIYDKHRSRILCGHN